MAAEGDVRVTLSDNTLGRALGRQDLIEGVEHNRGALGTIANNRIEAKQNPPGGNADVGIPVTTLFGQGSRRAVITNNQLVDEGADDSGFPSDAGILADAASQAGTRVSGNVVRCYENPVDIQGRDPDALGRNRVDDSSCAAP